MGRNRKRHQFALAIFALAACVSVVTLLFMRSSGRDGEGDSPGAIGAEEAGTRLDHAGQGLSWTHPEQAEVRHSEADISEEGARLLESYEQRGDCVLAGWGYLDIWGNVWSCVVDGGDWADVCYLSTERGGTGCEVRIMHIDADELEQAWLANGGGLA